MAQEPTFWLHEKLLEMILKKSENDESLKVFKVDVKPATNKGDNYMSEMLRVSVEFSKGGNKNNAKKMSVIVKVTPRNEGFQKEIARKIGTFETEISMMSDTLNRMNQKLGGKNPLSPREFYSHVKEPSYLVMEDLAPLGYKMGNRLDGLDLQHCILAIQGLARFHAASIAVCENDPQLKTRYVKGQFTTKTLGILPEFGVFFVSTAKALSQEISKWPELDKKYSQKILKMSDNIYNIGIKYSSPHEEDFNVINHGDFWINNMLFQYDSSGKPISHIMVDFQFPMYTTPALDLSYFLSTSASEQVFENHKNNVIEEYHKTLVQTMQEIVCKKQPPSLEKLKKHLNERAALEMIMTFAFLPIFLADKSDVLSVDEMMSQETVSSPGLRNPRFRTILGKRLPVYEKMGLLDINC